MRAEDDVSRSRASAGELCRLAWRRWRDWTRLRCPHGASREQIYERERAIVSSYRVVPLVWLPRVYGLGARVRDWKAPAPGEGWPLADVWLEQESQ